MKHFPLWLPPTYALLVTRRKFPLQVHFCVCPEWHNVPHSSSISDNTQYKIITHKVTICYAPVTNG